MRSSRIRGTRIKRRLDFLTFAALSVGVFLFSSSGFVLCRMVTNSLDGVAGVAESYELRSVVAGLNTDLKLLRGSARGYLLSGDEDLAGSMGAGKEAVARAIEEAKRLTLGHPVQLPRRAKAPRSTSSFRGADRQVKPTRVFLADDHQLVRAGMRAPIDGFGDFEVVAECGDGREALMLARQYLPDIVVMDVSMPGLNGLDAAVRIAKEHPAIRVVMLSMHTAENYVLEALRAGAHGYMVKDAAPEDLERALRPIARGERYLSPAISMQPSITVVGSASTLEGGVRLVEERKPSVVLIGPLSNPEEAAGAVVRIKQGSANPKVIAVTDGCVTPGLRTMPIASSDAEIPRLAGPERLLFKLTALTAEQA